MARLDESNGTFASNSSRDPTGESDAPHPATFEELFETESGITRLGSYVPLHKLGQGGMGVVYAAYDEKLDRKVAIKLLRARGNEIARARMIREARAMARLSHPNVAQVYGIEEFGEQLFIVVEFVDGVTLKAWLAERARTRDEILAVFHGAGEGLAAAHAAGLVHRDFKPDNVMVRRDGRVLVMDFGLVHSALDQTHGLDEAGSIAEPDVDLTRTGALMGTPAYMAPEQFLGGETDARSDQFSFCITLWEALYGHRPFSAGTMQALIQAVTSGTFTQVDHREVPAWLREVIVRGLAVAPEQRWPSMAALLSALGRDPKRRRGWMAATAGVFVVAAIIAGLVVREVDRRESALVDSQAAVARGQAELESKEHELEQQRRSIDDAGNVEKALQATLLVNERRGLEALLLAVEAAGPYGPDYMSAPTAVLQALFDVQTVIIVGSSRVMASESTVRHLLFTPVGTRIIGVMHEPSAMVWDLEGLKIGRLEGYVPPDAGENPTVNACAVRLSHEGEPVELFSGDGLGRIWDASGQLLFSPQTGRINPGGIWTTWAESMLSIDPVLWARPRNVAVSPTGQFIVFYDKERGYFELWGETSRPVKRINAREGGRLVAGFSADGSRAAVSRGIGPIVVADESGRALGISDDSPTTTVIAVSSDGTTIVTGHQSQTLGRRDGSVRSLAILPGHTTGVMGAAVTHDATSIASGGQDRTIRIWNESNELGAVLNGHNGRVTALAFSSNESFLASGSDDETVRLWGLHAPLASAAIRGASSAREIVRSSDGTLLAVRDPGRLYSSDGRLLVEFEASSGEFGFSPDSSMFVAIDGRGGLRLWDRAGHTVGESDGGATGLKKLLFAPDSSCFFATGKPSRHCLWNTKGECLAHLPIDGMEIDAAAFTSTGDRLLTKSPQDKFIRVWDRSGTLLSTIPTSDEPRISPDDSYVFSCTPDEAPKLWNLSGDFIAELVVPVTNRLECGLFAMSPDGQVIATKFNETIYMWNRSGVLIRSFVVQGSHLGIIAFSPDGSRLTTGGDEGRIWTIDGTLVATLEGHVDSVHAVRYSPDGRLLATGSSDLIRLWDSEQGRLIASLDADGSGNLSFSDDGSRLTHEGSPARVWLRPDAAMQRACEILPDFPEEYRRVAHICERVRQGL